LTRRQQRVLDAVPLVRPAPADSIARAAGLGASEVRATLDDLVRSGFADRLPTGWRLADGPDGG
jgi:DNA processing protein